MMSCAVSYDEPTVARCLNTDEENELRSLLDDRVQFDVPMRRYTTLAVGGPADAVAMPHNIEALGKLFAWIQERKIPWLVVGAGSNLLVRDGGIRGVVIALTPYFKGITASEDDAGRPKLVAKAGTRLQSLCRYTIDRGWGDMTFALGIPASVGGALAMNAGAAQSCMANVLGTITVLWPTGQVRRIHRRDIDFGYRRMCLPAIDGVSDSQSGIIVEGTFHLKRVDSQLLVKKGIEIKKDRKLRQPTGVSSAGCFFKNPVTGPSAGELIDKAGLKGKQVGGAIISPHHANFIINRKNARAADVLALAKCVQARVADHFGVRLEPEVVIAGDSHYAPKSV